MVVLIFEGCDNLGKTTLINKFIEEFRNTRDIVLIHSRGPERNCPDPFEFQKNFFKNVVNKIIDIASFEKKYPEANKHIVLLDRSWYGEYVYGQIYRNGDPDKILKKIIDKCDFKLAKNKISTVDVYLRATSEFIVNHDDGLSLSSEEEYQKKIGLVNKELLLFDECFINACLCAVNRPFVEVNVENAGEFKDINELYNQLKDTIVNQYNINL